MAYDPNDPADKKILDDAVAEALEEQREAHETEIDGLKKKNRDLLNKLSQARKDNGGDNTAEIERLEKELEESQNSLRTAQSDLRETNRKLKSVEQERETFKQTAETEAALSRDMVVESSLTSALTAANVAPQFLDAAKALLGKSVTVKDEEGKRKAFVGDKSLGDYVNEWAASDAGKPFVKAPANGGGGSSGTPLGGGSKKISEMSIEERNAAYKADPAGFNARFEAENKAA